MNRNNRSNNERGQSLVELAIILLVVLILLAGVVDLGRMMFEYLSIRDAAQEAAGYGAIYPNYCEEIQNRVAQTYPNVNGTVAVYVDGTLCTLARDEDSGFDLPKRGCSGNEIIVNIIHYSDVTMPFLGPIIDPENDGVKMDVEIKDRIVRPKCYEASP